MTMQLRARGFTLIEVVIAILIITFSLIAVVGALTTGSMQSARSLVMLQSEHLANAYLADAMSLPYQDVLAPIGKEATRATYDDVSDYNGDIYSPITDRTGGAVAGYPGFSAQFAVVARTVGPTNVPAFEVAVTVTAPDGTIAVASGLRMNTP